MADRNEISSFKTKLKSYFISMRPWSFTASGVSVLLGSVLASKVENVFDFRLLLLTLTSVLSTHAAGNLVNTLYDFKNSIDTKSSDDKTLVDRILDPQEVTSLVHLCYQISVASFVVICLAFPQASLKYCLPLFVAGVLASFLYTGSIGLKYIAMGDVVVFTAFGPLIALFSYCVQSGQFWSYCIAYSIPLSLLTEAILHSNNIRDLETDKLAGIVTMPILLGQSNAFILYSVLLFLPYCIIIIMAFLQSYWLILPLLSLPLAVRLNSECWHGNHKRNHDDSNEFHHGDLKCHHDNEHHDIDSKCLCSKGSDKYHHGYSTDSHGNNKCCHGNLADIPQKTAMLNLIFGGLYVVSLLIR